MTGFFKELSNMSLTGSFVVFGVLFLRVLFWKKLKIFLIFYGSPRFSGLFSPLAFRP